MPQYLELINYLSSQFEEINGYDFYNYIFPENEMRGELKEDFSSPNAVYLYQDDRDADSKRRLRRRIMLKDTWEADYMEFVEKNPLTLCSGLVYRGRTNKLEKAQRMNALIFDLDGVGIEEIGQLFNRFGKSSEWMRTIPTPTFLVSSGTGLHIYYVFDRPIDLYPNIKLQLKALKYDLTFRMWEYKATSTEKQIQYQSINQGFRMVGSTNSKYNVDLKAFKVGDKVTLEYLNRYVDDSRNKVDINKPFRPSQHTKEEAKELYPEWYQRVVVEKNKNAKKWDIKSKQGYALYEWWIKQAPKAKGGHRYFFLMCMVIYACKCDVPKSKLKSDMEDVFEYLQNIEHKNPLTREDIESALETYDREYYNFKIEDIEQLTDIRIDRNKRNGRKQSLHLRMARSNLAIMNEDGGFALQGRPSAKEKVLEWRKENPTESKAECNRQTKLDPKTIRKWWGEYDKLVQIAFRQMEEERIEKERREELQKQANELVFAESEVTPTFIEKLAENGIGSINVVPDEEYEQVMFENWLKEIGGNNE